MASTIRGRALHYVFKVGNREASYDFYVKKLGMKVLRHEEYDSGCKATCNGPYGGAWSKTMVGYGGEDKHFVLELTYNYGINNYKLGNDFGAIYVESDTALNNVKGATAITENGTEYCCVQDPDGHRFYIKDGKNNTPVTKVTTNVQNLQESKDFWQNLITMKVEQSNDKMCRLSFGEEQCKLELHALPSGETLKRESGSGRIAFSCPVEQLKPLEAKVKKVNEKFIQTPHTELETPGKATVEVVILLDPNEHEICFVGEEAFLELSKVDPKADKLFKDGIEKAKNWNEKS